jgi:hypothetical protein
MLFVAVAAWAQLTAGVTLDYMWAQDFGPGKEFSDRPILELKFTYKADDFTSVYVELEEGPLNSQGDTAGGTSGAAGGLRNVYSTTADAGYDVKIAGLDRAYFTTDVGKAMKLPVPVVVMYGYQEWNGKDGIKVTKSEFEDYLGEADIRNWGAQIEVMPSPMVTLRSNWAWNPNAAVDPAKGAWLINAYGTVAPISYELTYFTHGFEFAQGWIEGGVKFAQDINKDINVAAMVGFEVDMASGVDYFDAAAYGANDIRAYGWKTVDVDATAAVDNKEAPTSWYLMQAGLQVMYQKMMALGVSYRGAEAMLAGAVQLQGYFTPKAGDPLEAFVNLGLGLDTDTFDSAFDSVEVALRYTMGKVMWYLGFFYNAEFGRGVAKEQADFDLANVPFGETSAIFMRGKVSL